MYSRSAQTIDSMEGSPTYGAGPLLASALAALLIIIGLGVAPAPAHAVTQTHTIDGVTYTVDDANPSAGATVTAYDASHGTSVAIPSVVNIDGSDYIVTSIGNSAFEAKGLTAILLPSQLRSIGSLGFSQNALTSVVIPSAVTSIGVGAFEFNQLTSVVIPQTLTTIPAKAFVNNQLTSVALHDGITHIGQWAFGNNHLTSLDIPAGLSEIEDASFAGNDLVTLHVPGNVKRVGESAFKLNPSLTSVTLEDGVERISQAAFAWNTDGTTTTPCNISTLNLGNTVKFIGTFAFQGCKITSLTVPESTEIINISAFDGNPIGSLDLGSGVETIYFRAFRYAEITHVTIPASVVYLGDGSFEDSAALTSVRFLGSVPTNLGNPLFIDKSIANPSIEYYWRYGVEAGVTGGFTSPLWLAKYPSTAIAVVDFDLHGHGTQVLSQDVTVGDKPTDPGASSETGWIFGGWYTDATFATSFDFATAVTRDATAHAKWTQVTNEVSFDLQGHGTAIAPVTVAYGDKVTEPPEPTETGWTFGGWFSDATLLNPYDFETGVTAETTTYAAWTIESYAVTFDPGNGDTIPAASVDYGGGVPQPAVEPVRDGYKFLGWFAGPGASSPYDFNTPVTGELALSASWQRDAVLPKRPTTRVPDQAQIPGQNQSQLSTTGSADSDYLAILALIGVGAGFLVLLARRRGKQAS